jgi:hypothetical protein
MALIAPRVIARVSSSSASEFVVMSWEWIMRADGQVFYRLTKVDGRRERNPWNLVTQVAAAELQALSGERAKATAVLDDLARQHGHKIG